MDCRRLELFSKEISPKSLISWTKNLIPIGPRPEEPKIDCFAREAFLLLNKLVCVGSLIYGATLLATGGIPALLVISAVALAILNHKMAPCLPEKISKVATPIFAMIDALAISVAGLGLYGLGIRVVMELFLSIATAAITDQWGARRFSPFISIGGENDTQELQKLIDEKRVIQRLEVDWNTLVCSDTMEQTFKLLRELRPQEIAVNGPITSINVKSLNEGLGSSNSETLQFYYISEKKDCSLLRLAETPAHELKMDQKGTVARKNYFEAFKDAREALCNEDPAMNSPTLADSVERVIISQEGSTYDSLDELESILKTFSPATITFGQLQLSQEVLEFLNVPRGKKDSYHYVFKTADSAERVDAKKEYHIGIGQVLSSGSILSSLGHVTGNCPLETIIITQAKDQEPIEITTEIFEYLKFLNPQKIELINCKVPKKIDLSFRDSYSQVIYDGSKKVVYKKPPTEKYTEN